MKYMPISFKSDYSLLKSILKISDIIEYAKNSDSSYAGILDDNPYAIMDFYDKCTSNGLKCIFGMKVRIGESIIYLYIKDYNGYLNIIKINELINDNSLTIDNLFKYNEGLIAVLPYENYNLFNRIKTVFPVYLGYRSDYEYENAVQISKNVLFINEILCLDKKDETLLKMLYKIDGNNYSGNNNYVLNASDRDVKTILDFVNNIDFRFNFDSRYIPIFKDNEEESIKTLRTLSIKGLTKRCDGKVSKVYADRLKYELNVIESMGFVDYFLIVYDYVKYARKNNIIANPRGSAAGSLVAYAIGITEVDPIKYDLLFERFLNPERVTMPDIDVDFEDTRRSEVIDYVRSKYGEKRVSLIVAYGTLGSKQVVRDVGKIMNIDQNVIDKLSKMLDAKKSLKNNLKDENIIKYVKDNNLESMYKISIRLEGLKRHTTIHAAGVVISSENLTNIVPVIKTNDGILTGFTMEYLERLGLLKMDFLALRNLTTMHNIVNIIKKKEPNFDLKNIPLDDKNTYDLFSRADTDNVFQFESNGMKNFLRKLKPSKFDDLVAANALFRPGPMQNIDEYVSRRHGKKSITYLHKDLEPILKSTYGIIIYQEQIMQILSLMGGYSFAEADLIRRAMSKKKHDVMEREKVKFIKQACEKGYCEQVSKDVYDLIVKFADYGFNKSHSVAYAQVGYYMAYMKANYKDAWDLCTLNMNTGITNTKDAISNAKMRGLNLIKPDINKSHNEYVIDGTDMILPLTSIKGISASVSKVILDNAPYEDFFDLFKKVYNKGVNRNNIEDLIKAGAMDSFGYSRNTLIENVDSVLTYLELANSLDESLVSKPDIIESNKEDDKLNELDIFGFYITGHPASIYDSKKYNKINTIKEDNKYVTMAVLIDKIKVINTKKGEKMAFLDVSDDTGNIDAVIFPRNNHLLERINTDDIIVFKGNTSKKDGEIQIIINEIIETKKGN